MEWFWKAISWILRVVGTTGIHAAITDSFRLESKKEKDAEKGSFIETCGQVFLEKFQKIMKSIISMETQATIQSTTLPVCIGGNISACMDRRMGGDLRRGTQPNLDNGIIRKLLNGDGQPTEKKRWAMPLPRFQQPKKLPQNGTETPLIDKSTSRQDEKPGTSESPLPAYAQSAIRSILRIGGALSSAGRIAALKTFAQDTVVYDLTVEDDHCFIANGILTSNSHASESFAYGAAMLQQDLPNVKVEPIPIKGMTVGIQTHQTLDEMWADAKKRQTARRRI